MIIQVRGTSGSGKSTVVKSIMECYDCWIPAFVRSRKRPLWYRRGEVYILGHYESPCGGCDTIGSARQVYELIQSLPKTATVLCEGLLLSEDVKWSTQLDNLTVLFLITPVEECIRRITVRRAMVGNKKPLSEKNTRDRVARIGRARLRLLDAGVHCRRCSDKQAIKIIRRMLDRGNT